MTRFKLESAKNGEMNLIVDHVYYYSKYNPSNDVSKFIASKIGENYTRYIIFGVGLGYHIEELLIQQDKEIIIYESDQELLQFLNKNKILDKFYKSQRVTFIHNLKDVHLTEQDQLIILPAWKRHLKNEKMKLAVEMLEFEWAKGSNSDVMFQNFSQNIKSNWKSIKPLANQLNGKKAVLVAAGPDLDNQIDFLKRAQNNAYILSVSAAYKTLKAHNIKPDGIVAIDQRVEMSMQVEEVILDIPLFLLSTVHPSFTSNDFEKYLLFQKNLDFVEQYAKETDNPLIESHGSVATATLSLLQYFSPDVIIFVGQDLAMHRNQTHSTYSASNYKVLESSKYVTINNNHENVATQLQWLIFKRHIEKQIREYSQIQYINTSLHGAKIEGAPYRNSKEIEL